MNGFLSAIGDGSIAGYAAGAPTAIGSAATASLVSAINTIAYVPDSIRVAFEAEWSDPRSVDPVLLVRRALDTPVSWRAALAVGNVRRFAAAAELRSALHARRFARAASS